MKRLALESNARYEAPSHSGLYPAGFRVRQCHFKGTKSRSKDVKNREFHEEICDYFTTKSRDAQALCSRAIFYFYLFDSKGVSSFLWLLIPLFWREGVKKEPFQLSSPQTLNLPRAKSVEFPNWRRPLLKVLSRHLLRFCLQVLSEERVMNRRWGVEPPVAHLCVSSANMRRCGVTRAG